MMHDGTILEKDDKKNATGALRTILIFAALFFVYIWGLGDAGLMEPDEGRYAEIPRNMIATGDYVTPRLNGLKYFEKPVLCYWLNVASFKLLGENAFAARLPVALLALAGVAATWSVARKMYGRTTADWSAVVLGTSLLYYAIGRINILDMPVSAFLTIAMALAWFAIDDRERGNFWLCLAFAALGAAVLTKGLMGIVLPGGIILCYALLSRNPGIFRRFLLFLPGWAILLAVTVPWFWAVCVRNPDFFYFFFVHEQFLRYTTTVHDRMEPFWFFLPILIAGFVPWLGFLPGAFRDAFKSIKECFARRSDNSPELYLLCWSLFILLFFSASHSKLIPYIVPAMPPLAILTARAIELRTDTVRRRPGLLPAFLLNAVVLLVLAGGLLTLRRYFRDARFDVKLAWQAGRVIGMAMILFVVLSAVSLKRVWAGRFAHFVPLFMPVAALVLIYTLQPVQLVIASRKSAYELCENLKKVTGPDDIFINYKEFIQAPQFYLGRRMVLVDYTGELEFGKEAEPELARKIFMTDAEFEKFVETPTSGDKIIIFEDDRGMNLPSYVGRGARVAATSHNFTAIRLRR